MDYFFNHFDHKRDTTTSNTDFEWKRPTVENVNVSFIDSIETKDIHSNLPPSQKVNLSNDSILTDWDQLFQNVKCESKKESQIDGFVALWVNLVISPRKKHRKSLLAHALAAKYKPDPVLVSRANKIRYDLYLSRFGDTFEQTVEPKPNTHVTFSKNCLFTGKTILFENQKNTLRFKQVEPILDTS